MTDRTKDFIRAALMIGICLAGITFMYQLEGRLNHDRSIVPPPDTISSATVFMDSTAKEGLIDALEYYDIHHPDIVYAQAILETGHFRSIGCLEHNNLFGLYNSRANRYCRFDHWTESVIAYKEWIQKRYKPPEDYYKFLQRIRYASDPQYISKLKQIVKKENDKRRYAEGDTVPQGV